MVIDDKTRLKSIILFLKESAVNGALNVSDDVIFTRSHSQYISELIEQSKNPKKTITNKIEEVVLATDKQKSYMDKLKIKYPQNITKKEAIELLKEATS
ncbi:MAG: hypothetical protein AABW89_05950 [Nanoarchaeota archaeon]